MRHKEPDGYKRLEVSVPEDVFKWLQDTAKDHNMTTMKLMRRLIARFMIEQKARE